MGQKKQPPTWPFVTDQTVNGNRYLAIQITKDMTASNWDSAEASFKCHARYQKEKIMIGDVASQFNGFRCTTAWEAEKAIEGMTQERIGEFIDLLTSLNESLEYEHSFIADAIESANKQIERMKAKDGYGTIYVIGFDRWVKVGRTVNMRQRLSGIKLPVEPVILAEYAVQKCASVEAMLHRHFCDMRANGEWFELGSEELAELAQLVEPYLEKSIK
jgi:hypothetical protein